MKVYVAFGSNVGCRISNIRKALDELKKLELSDVRHTHCIETSPILLPNSPIEWSAPYLNAVASFTTAIKLEQLLILLQEIEKKLGRPTQRLKWAPRIIDIDILMTDSRIMSNTPFLTLPHPEILNRPFLIHLLATLEPSLTFFSDNQYTNKTFLEIAHCTNAIQNLGEYKSFAIYPKIMGILNVTEDSFSDGGLYNTREKAVSHFISLENAGASIIDIGAESTRPGAKKLSHEEEYTQLDNILSAIGDINSKVEISIDSYHFNVIQRILEKYSNIISYINLVQWNFKPYEIHILSQYEIKFIIMHSLSVPPSPTFVLPTSTDLIQYIGEWSNYIVDCAIANGISASNLILDVGIGFGKTHYQSIELLRRLRDFKNAFVRNLPILVGHSRKSYINAISLQTPIDRDLETSIISASIAQYTDYLRVHNVTDTHRACVTHNIMNQKY
ncbi:dihydropteroate synthase [Candidatus Fokinia crypta]|uniref:Dihydropteroate synthase n=1 Tax=Candidatus Fokinia crypta TaxID=1920990 RepID=A0ABZ0UPW0_9RICK|nr:dihydropteroate synthase [Candidatus Fokinia cryptica]WPX97577.1 Dihydropteroate synthase [Candidatus Fokinia cryptica]